MGSCSSTRQHVGEDAPIETSTVVVFGRHERTLKARQKHPYDSHTITKPTASTGTPWKDNKFPFTIKQEGTPKPVKFSWKRPTDYAFEKRLFGDTINRYSVKQGQLGDCFFMSTLSSIADQPKLIKQIMPPDAYEVDAGRYSGIFHCRFWWMGEWIDVYTDDFLPYNEDIARVYAGHSEDKNVVWVPLMEKALARLCGGYNAVCGDQANAYALLTGGLVETLKIRKRDTKDEILPLDSCFARIKQALDSGAIVLTSIDQREAYSPHLKGLATNHCYSINEAIKVKHGDATDMLLKIRNPWGETNKVKPVNDNGEWRGRWSYGSLEWNEVSKDIRNRHNVEFEKGGEFWVCIEDFYKIFERIYVADIIPNFDEDGFRKSNQLNKVINILGEWHGATAAGNNSKNLFKNPRFLLIIPNKGLSGDNRMPTVIQLILQYDHPVKDTDNKDNLYCRIDVFRVEKEQTRDNQLHMCLTDISITEAYVAGRENTCRYRLTPGKYILVPNFLDDTSRRRIISQPFCIRVFTATPLFCREYLDYPVALTGKPCETFESNDSSSRKQVRTVNVFGEWKGETAAGSDPVNRFKNPRFILTIPGNRKINKISFQLRQSRDIERTLHCRLDVFKFDLDITRNRGQWIVMNQITNMGRFMAGGEVSYDYELASGKYLLLPTYSGKERISCPFCLRILAHTQVNCRSSEENQTLFVRTIENNMKHEDKSYSLGILRCFFGEWVKDQTAGGQIRFNSFSKNPQYGLTVEGNAPQPLLISLMQESVTPTHAIGCLTIQMDDGQSIPLDNEALKRGTRVKTIEGRELSFVQQSESSGYYVLAPGRYVILVFADQPTDEKKFALAIFAQSQSKLILTEPK